MASSARIRLDELPEERDEHRGHQKRDKRPNFPKKGWETHLEKKGRYKQYFTARRV